MKKLFAIAGMAFCCACNVSTDEHEGKDSTRNGADSFILKVDTTLEQFGDSVKAKYKDVKREVKTRFDKDDRESDDTTGR